MFKKTILVVEDHEDMQSMYRDILGSSYNLKIVGDTKKALEELENDCIDLMILDIILPHESGDTFLAHLKEKIKYKNLKVLAITVLGDVGSQLREIDRKVECLPKPFEKKDLLAMVKKML